MIRTAIATLAAGAALTTGISVAPSHLASADARGLSDQTACQRLWDALPSAMQDDILAALSQHGRAQHRALFGVRYGALHGAYGDRVEARAKALQHRRIELWRTLPDQLKADVRAARALPYREQRQAMIAIRDAALRGDYGDRVQELAERRQAFLEGCPDEVRTYLVDEADPLAG
jgi:hypothetical protein